MNKMHKIGKWEFGVFCGEKLWSLRSWRRYGIFDCRPGITFSIGPVGFWKLELQGLKVEYAILDEVSNWDHIREGLDSLANGGLSVEELQPLLIETAKKESNDDRT